MRLAEQLYLYFNNGDVNKYLITNKILKFVVKRGSAKGDDHISSLRDTKDLCSEEALKNPKPSLTLSSER